MSVPVDTKAFMDNMISKQKTTCYVHVFGGLGNQLFQIATGLNYCIEHNMNLKLYAHGDNNRKYYWDSILSNYSDFLISNIPNTTYSESCFAYRCIPWREGEDIVLHGYYQSAKYFKNILSSMKYLLTFPEGLKESIEKKYGRIFSDNYVIVHARRGDYLNALPFHGVMSDEYYKKSISLMKQRVKDPLFILISDDMDYWKNSEVFKDEKVILFDESDIDTLFLMMNSHNFVIPNSTFSWWGATLSGSQNVIAPAKWFGPMGPQDWYDIYNDSWTIL